MKQKLLLFAFTLLSTILFSQAVPMAFEDWKTTMGTQNFFYKNVTKTDFYGNIYVAGATVNGAGNTDILLAKYSSAGVQLWIQQYAGAGLGNDFATDMFITSNAIYLTGGVATSTASPTTDVITMKYNLSGVLQWVSTYNGAGNSFDAGRGLAYHTQSNTLYVSGGTYNSSLNSDILAMAYNSSGTQLWANTYNYTSNLDDAGVKIAIGGSTVAVTGAVTNSTNNYKNATVTFDKATGTLTAVNISTAVTTSSVNTVTDLVIDASNNYYVVGSSLVSGQGYNYYVQKLNSSLVTAWTYTYNGASNLDDIAKGVQVDVSGNVYITGYSTSSTQGRNIVTIKLNSSGVNQWTQTINGAANGDDEANDMVLDVSANVYVTGYIKDALNNKDYYTAKYNTSGAKLWEIQTDGNHLNDQVTNLALDSLKNVIVTGQTETALNTFNFTTVKYVQKEVITPTDFNSELPDNNRLYYPNKGQLTGTNDTIIPDVKYYSYNTYPKFFIKDKSQIFLFSKIDTSRVITDTLHRIDLQFNGSSENVKTYPMNEVKTSFLNYVLAHTGAEGVTGVYGNNRLVTPNLYNNIDLMYSSNQNGIKYYFIVKPGGDPRNIQLEFSGASSFNLNGTTNVLSINSSVGSLAFDRPTAYQLSATNSTIAVTGWTPDWQTNGANNKYKFNSGTYTTSLTLIIEIDQGNSSSSISNTLDNIMWTTYYGGSDQDYYRDGAYSADNNYYTCGYSYSSGLPKFPGQHIIAAYTDMMITKFNSDGQKQWTTKFGGTDHDFAQGVAIDNNNYPIIVGNSYSINMPLNTPTGAYTRTLTSQLGSTWVDAAILRLKPLNGVPDWSTYMGGSGYDEFNKVAISSNNSIFVIGHTQTTNFPYYGNNSFNQSCANNTIATENGIIVKFTNLFPVASTCIGGNATDEWLTQLCLDKNNDDLYVVGYGGHGIPITTPSSGNPYTQSTLVANREGFILKYNASNTRLWSTYFGGSGEDYINTIGVNDSGEVYIAGQTGSYNLPHKFYNYPTGHNDTIKPGTSLRAFIARFNKNDSLIWSTYYQPYGRLHEITDIEFDNHMGLFVVATNNVSGTTSFPAPTGAYYVNVSNGFDEGFIGAFSKEGINTWGTFFGGNYYDVLRDLSFDGNNKMFFCGSTGSYNSFPLANNNGLGTLYSSLNGTYDANAGFFQVLSSFVGIKEHSFGINSSNILVFPNPAKDELNIVLKDNSLSLTYEIVNIHGQLVSEGMLQNNKIILPNLAQGMYIITLKNKIGTYTQKFIKE